MPDTVIPTRSDDNWLTPGRFAVLLAVLVFALCPQVLTGLQTFVYRDFGYFSYPIAFHLRESFWHGEFPLWNPLSNCGIPFLAQWNTQVLYPPALFYVLLPITWALPVFCLLHLYLGGMGMFFLARRWSGNNFAAGVAGIAFAFNGLMLNSLMWPATIPGFGWMPWVMLLTGRAWCEGGRLVILAALSGALQMLSGAVEVILMTWMLLGMMGLIECFRGERPRSRILLRSAIVVALVALLSAAQLLPFLDLVARSSRQQNFDASLWPMPGTGWANFLVPLFLENRSYNGPFLQRDQYWTFSYYVGVLTVPLAIWAILRARTWRAPLLAVLTLVCLVLALGDATPIYSWMKAHVAIVGLMRFPVKFVILPVFALPLLAAFGLAKLVKNPAEKSWWGVCAATLLLVLGLSWLTWNWSDNPFDAVASALNGVQRAGILVGLVILLAFAGRSTQVTRRRLLQFVVLIGLWFDVARHEPAPQTVNVAVYQPQLPRSWALPRFGEARAMISFEAESEFSQSIIPHKPDEDYISRRFASYKNCNLIEGFPKVDGFFPLRLRDYDLFAQLLYSRAASDPAPEPLLEFLGVKQVTAHRNIFDWTARSNPMPLITGGQLPIFDGEAPTMKYLAAPNFDPHAEVYLLREAKAEISITNATPVEVSDARFAANRIEARVSAAAPALVVVAQTFHPNWRVYVDGSPGRLLRANLAFQAFQIPAGDHEARLVYEDRAFQVGAALSLATLLGCAMAWFTLVRCKTGQT